MEKEENKNGGVDGLLLVEQKGEAICGEGEVWWIGWLSSMKSKAYFVYRGSKRVIVSTKGQNLNP